MDAIFDKELFRSKCREKKTSKYLFVEALCLDLEDLKQGESGGADGWGNKQHDFYMHAEDDGLKVT